MLPGWLNPLPALAIPPVNKTRAIPTRSDSPSRPRYLLLRLGFGRTTKALRDFVLGAGLEPACLSAYAPQTYVSAIPPPERVSANLIGNAGKQEVRANDNLETRKPRNQEDLPFES